VYELLLFIHFVGLAMGVGTGFAHLTLGLAMKDLPPEERAKVALRNLVLSKNGSIGLLLLIVSGVGLMLMKTVTATFAAGGPAFHAKLTLIVIFIGVFGYSQALGARAKRENGGPALAKLPVVGRIMFFLGLSIVAAAVIAFK
jgi:uncharacterized membrane protein SirB2